MSGKKPVIAPTAIKLRNQRPLRPERSARPSRPHFRSVLANYRGWKPLPQDCRSFSKASNLKL